MIRDFGYADHSPGYHAVACHRRAWQPWLRRVDLTRQSELSAPTVHCILRGLMAENFVRKDTRSHRYFLGSLLFEFGLAAAPRFDLRRICEPALSRLATRTGDTVYLISRSGSDAVCLDRKLGEFP
jgi:DNA-binding IclR family transcriptional regulator